MPRRERWIAFLVVAAAVLLFAGSASASLGDRLDEFKDCLAICQEANCGTDPTPIPLHHRLLLWTCPSTCDYTCQHIVTHSRLTRPVPHLTPIHQFHGKWPFHRLLGLQEPFSVLFSLLNLAAHAWGLSHLHAHIPASYPLRPYYTAFAATGYLAWTASAVFHARDFPLTETLDYFAAGGSVLYGLYFSVVRVARLDSDPPSPSPSPKQQQQHPHRHYRKPALRLWTLACATAFAAHVAFLTLVRWDYTYNMGANVAVGIAQNVVWVSWAARRFRRTGEAWTLWPAGIVACVCVAMSAELGEFVPWRLVLDAHAVWHAGTVGPTVWWYCFLVKDALDDMKRARLKA